VTISLKHDWTKVATDHYTISAYALSINTEISDLGWPWTVIISVYALFTHRTCDDRRCRDEVWWGRCMLCSMVWPYTVHPESGCLCLCSGVARGGRGGLPRAAVRRVWQKWGW